MLASMSAIREEWQGNGKSNLVPDPDLERSSYVKSRYPCPILASVDMSHNRALLGLPLG